MANPSPNLSPALLNWSPCGHGATAKDPVGCRGVRVRVRDRAACLAHLDEADRAAYLATLSPGADIDHRGTRFTEDLLDQLLNALRDPTTGHPRLGTARFNSATFQDAARFDSATFQGNARFNLATFQGAAGFDSATFQDNAWFGAAIFQGTARFDSATFQDAAWFRSATFRDAWFGAAIFQGDAGFDSATFQSTARFWSAIFQDIARFNSAIFQDIARFDSATFRDDAEFDSATFQSNARFDSATFQSTARFDSTTFQDAARFWSATFQSDTDFVGAVFERTATLGPLVCAGRVRLSRAVFDGPVTLAFAARRLECQRTRWSSMAELRLRYATVDFSHAVFEYPLTIAAETVPFVLFDGQPVEEHVLADVPDAGVRLVSLRGVDAAHLVLADVDLSGCRFAGTVHLDQLRLEGRCRLATTPSGLRRRGIWPVRWTPRQTLAEEQHWRAARDTGADGWTPAPEGEEVLEPVALAPVYRALRKAFEDGKNEPGAADFYYGEMEMRRHDRIGTPPAERRLLHLYWAVSGYGLRASRALSWLAAAMLLTIVLLMSCGIPQDSPEQEATGTVPPGGGRVTFTIDKADPKNPTGDRFTGERFEKAVNVTLNSVVFHSSGQELTTFGTYTEMASRFAGPVLLGLAVLAVRSRVKR